MFNQDSTKVSLFDGPITNTKPSQALTIYQIYSLIVGEGKGNNLRERTEKLRSLTGDERKKFKSQNLPFVLFGGEFSQRNIKGLTRPSNLIGVDFDHIGDEAQVEAYKQTLSKDSDLDPVLLFRSPSGDGLKVVVNLKQEVIGDKEFKLSFEALRNYIETKYPDLRPQKTEDGDDKGFDNQVKDISRACFLCYDGQAVLNQAGQGFDVLKWKPQEKPKPQRDDRPLRETMNLTDGPSDLIRAVIGVEDIERSGICLTDSREDWRNVGFELSNLGEAGRDLFHRLSSMSAKYDPDGTDSFFTEALSRNYTGNRRELDSLFDRAHRAGVQMRSSNVYSQNPQKQGKQGGQTAQAGKPSDGPVQASQEAQNRPVKPRPDWLLDPTTEDDIKERESSRPEALTTGYQVEGQNGRHTLLLLAGTLTTIAGATNHGKTLWLLNLLLNVAKRYPERRFVLFTYEENSDSIIEYLLNIYLNELNLTRGGVDLSNRMRLKEYFSGQGTDNFNPEALIEFNRRKEMFFKNYIENGRILVKYIESDSTELCQNIEFLSSPENNVGGVLIDYFQCINPAQVNRNGQRQNFPTRQEALKSICFELKDTANRTGLPIVLSAQFNQEVLTPFDVQLHRIGEAGDISRIVSEGWGLWQMDNKRRNIGRELKGKEEKDYQELEQTSVNMGLRDPFLKGMILRVLKSRIVEKGDEMMFEFRGLTGKISPNDKTEQDIVLDDWNKPHPSLNMSDDDDLPEG